MLIMLVGLLGLLQAVNVALATNVRNLQREEVVRVAEEFMGRMRSQPFNSESTGTVTVPSKMRGTQSSYVVKRSKSKITSYSSSTVSYATNQYNVDVRYRYSNYSTYHSIVSLRGK